MKKLLLALMLSTTPVVAYAADMVVEEPVYIEPLLWSGGYIGLHAGYAWGRENDNQSDQPFSSAPSTGFNSAEADRFDLDGFIGGAHAGYNWQTGQFVFGVEGDIDYADMSGGADFSYLGGNVAGRLSFESDWQASLRLRAGYAVETWLLYATGGVALGHGELHARGDNFRQPFSESDDNTHTGWTLGAGVEKAFTPNWIGRLEVRYTDFGKESYDLGLGGEDIDVDWNQTAINVGFSYKY